MEISLRATLLMATCSALAAFNFPASAAGASVPSGAWAGEHIVMDVHSGGATVEFDCAHGSIDGTLTLDGRARFDLPGSFTRERGGPSRRDQPSAVPARYSGSLEDSTLTVTIVLTESRETVGVFTLKHGARARLFKCK